MRERTVYDKRDIKEDCKLFCKIVLAGGVIGLSVGFGELIGIRKTCTWVGNGIYKTVKTVKLPNGHIVGANEFMQELCKAIKEL